MNKKQILESAIKVIGVDLAKSSVVLHAVDKSGKTVLRKKQTHSAFLRWMVHVPPCLVGLEACGGAHHLARELNHLGHDVKLMAPQFVKPYVKSHKSDALDAEAICEAVQRPTMRFVAIKRLDQQDMQSLHRVRSLAVAQRTALSNQIRGLLQERGVVFPKQLANLRAMLPCLLEPGEDRLSEAFKQLLRPLQEDLHRLDERIHDYDKQFQAAARGDEVSRRLAQVPGIGPLFSTALPAAVGDVRVFANGRQLAAWLGLIPRQHSTGGQVKLMGMTKRGDVYLRWLLIHGARSVYAAAQRKTDVLSRWVMAVAQRRGKPKAIVALANKLARIAWALMARETCYQTRLAH